LLIAALGVPSFDSAHAQEPLGATIGENVQAGRLPTDFLSRIRVRTAYLSLFNDTQVVSTRAAGTYAPRPDLALRLQLPFPWVDPGVSTLESEGGVGDLSFRVLWRFFANSWFSAIVGTELFFPTASEPILGTEKYSIAPQAALVFRFWERFFFVPVYQQLISYAGNEDRADLNILRFRPIVLVQLPRRWWATLDPGFLWDLEDDLPTDDTMTMSLEVGKRITDRIAVTAKPGIQVYGSEDFAWSAELSLTFFLE